MADFADEDRVAAGGRMRHERHRDVAGRPGPIVDTICAEPLAQVRPGRREMSVAPPGAKGTSGGSVGGYACRTVRRMRQPRGRNATVLRPAYALNGTPSGLISFWAFEIDESPRKYVGARSDSLAMHGQLVFIAQSAPFAPSAASISMPSTARLKW